MKRALTILLLLCMLAQGALAAPLSLEKMTQAASGLAEFTIEGMPGEEYYEAVASPRDWISLINAEEYKNLYVDLELKYSWQELEELFYDISAHPIANVDIIGQSARGRNIYSVRVGRGSSCILLTGGVRAKETAGTMYILKQLCGLLSAYSTGNEEVMELLEAFTVVAVPCVNPDGRAVLELDEGIDWYSNDGGVDLDMNFPCANAGQLSPDASQAYHSNEPGSSDYPGAYLGSEPETKALIGWIEAYIDSAVVFIDYEQYGRYTHGGGAYLSERAQKASDDLAVNLAEFLSREDALYNFLENVGELRGWSGGSIEDFAAELGEGLAFSERYGRLGLDMSSGPLPLCFFRDIDEHLSAYTPRSVPLACVSIDISTRGGMGYYENARRNHAKEYDNCGYDELLVHVMDYAAEYLLPARP
ncbi:MAG: M14 family zinc carboxypeptidase [Eubacteriales bacterium]|nr:M14 family zinc carboxypeptidase [Eubacteriales bacterium]